DPELKHVRAANYLRALRHELLRLARACGRPHPAYVDLDCFELVDDAARPQPAREAFGYREGWGCPRRHPTRPSSSLWARTNVTRSCGRKEAMSETTDDVTDEPGERGAIGAIEGPGEP